MRPLKHGLLSFVPHIFTRKDIYYYRADIPSDIKHYFHTPEIKQSLKTKDSKIAKVMAISMEYRLQRIYALIRSGMLPEDIIAGMVAEIFPHRKPDKPPGVHLSSLIDDYVKANEDKWTHKTKIEIMACHRLIVDVIGDVEVNAISKQMVLDFKETMVRLPSNLYKKYSGKTIQEVLMLSDVVPMSTTSVKKHILRLNALMGYALKEGIVTINYAQGMMTRSKACSCSINPFTCISITSISSVGYASLQTGRHGYAELAPRTSNMVVSGVRKQVFCRCGCVFQRTAGKYNSRSVHETGGDCRFGCTTQKLRRAGMSYPHFCGISCEWSRTSF